MNSPVDKIKDRLSVDEVIGSYIELKNHGKVLKSLCPFHQEKTPSFVVSSERQSFYCFGCNKGGDIFTFVQEFEGIDFKGALKILADKAGVELNPYKTSAADKEEESNLYDILDTAKELYKQALPTSKTATAYIEKRGITNEIATRFELGFAPNSWAFALDSLKRNGFSEEQIEKTGLIIKRENGGYYDRFRNRLMFPIQDSSGRTVAFSGRILSKDEKSAKYINSPETKVFKKRDILFGIDKAKLAIRKLGFAILVEGQFDLVLSHQMGFKNTVATSGTALVNKNEGGGGSVSNLELVKRISKNLVIAFDSDSAGKKAAVKNARLAFSIGMDVKIAELPSGKDPADLIMVSKDLWKQVIKNSKDVVIFQLDEIKKNSKTQKESLRRIREEIFATIYSIPSLIEREHYLNSIAESIGMRSTTVFGEYEMTTKKKENTLRFSRDKNTSLGEDKDKQANTKKGNIDEFHMIAAMLEINDTFTLSDKKEIKNSKKSIELFQQIYEISPNEALSKLSTEDREKYLFEAEARGGSQKEREDEVEFLLKRIKIKELEKRGESILLKIKQAEEEADKDSAKKLLESYSSLTKELQILKETKKI